jgi:hypothetical protein
MRRSNAPALLVICATVPQPIGPGACAAWLDAAAKLPAGVTWTADCDTLAAVVAAARQRGQAVPRLALTLSPDWLDSRATLRRMLTAVREIVPGLDTAVLQGPRPLAHQSLLAEEGIRVAAVDTAADAGRGGRRPAPAGWRCRNPAWGLWEVQVDPAQPVGWMGWLRSGPLPRPRPGMLHVLHAGAVSAEQPGAGRLGRWLGWAAGQTAAGRLRLTGLGTLPAILARGESQPISGSVLKAA